MKTPRISASSYSNTAPLIWSFLYGTKKGEVELILDNAPARSAELLVQGRVDAALVPIIVKQTIENLRIVPGVCVGAEEEVRSVCLVTNGVNLEDVKSVALDVSSKTSCTLTKIIFQEFFGFEPRWTSANPDIDAMLAKCDCALLIGDPAISAAVDSQSKDFRIFDLVKLWRAFTGFGFVFAMWMTSKRVCNIDFVTARDEGLDHIDEIISNYESEIPLSRSEFKDYLMKNISYEVSASMESGMKLYFELARKIKKN